MKSAAVNSIQMERETLRRQAEEARRCGAVESFNNSRRKELTGVAPLFQPPVKISHCEDDLHVKLQKCLGNFEDVSGFLFKDLNFSAKTTTTDDVIKYGQDDGRPVKNGFHRRPLVTGTDQVDPPSPVNGYGRNRGKEMRDMIATPLTGISTPKQSKELFHYSPTQLRPYANGHREDEEKNHSLNGHSAHSPNVDSVSAQSVAFAAALPQAKKKRRRKSSSSSSCSSTLPKKRAPSDHHLALDDDRRLSDEKNIVTIKPEAKVDLSLRAASVQPCHPSSAMVNTGSEAQQVVNGDLEASVQQPSAVPENPWDIDYLISRVISKDNGCDKSEGVKCEQLPPCAVNGQANGKEVAGARSVDLGDSLTERSDVENSVCGSQEDSNESAGCKKRKAKKCLKLKRKKSDLATTITLPVKRSSLDQDCVDRTSTTRRPLGNGDEPTRLGSSTVKTESILHSWAQLPSLLSPIGHSSDVTTQRSDTCKSRRSPSSVVCQLDLNLVRRIPSPIYAKVVEMSRARRQSSSSSSSSPAARSLSKKSSGNKVASEGGRSAAIADQVLSATGSEKVAAPTDLDDVPILERVRKSLGTVVAKSSSSSAKQSPVGPSQRSGGSSTTKSPAPMARGDPPRPLAKRRPNAIAQHRRRANEQSPPTPVPKEEGARKANDSRFITCLLHVAPGAPVHLDTDEKDSPQFYLDKAKRIKRTADAQQQDKTLRILLYLESVVYFILTGHCMEKSLGPDSSRPYSMLKETCELLSGVSQKYFAQHENVNDAYLAFLFTKIEALSLRVQALLCRKLFDLRQTQALSNYRHICQYHKTLREAGGRQCSSANPYLSTSSSDHPSTPASLQQLQYGSSSNGAAAASCRYNSPGGPPSGGAHSPTPSPASSTGSTQSMPPGLVAIPQNMDTVFRQQFSHLHNLMWAHFKWNTSFKKLTPDDNDFFSHLDRTCAPLQFTSQFEHMCTYLSTAADWLRRFHSTESTWKRK